MKNSQEKSAKKNVKAKRIMCATKNVVSIYNELPKTGQK